MLELAKAIFTKHADSLATLSPTRLELEAKLSETYQTLGEVSIENENYPQAIEDLTMCLRRRQELLPEDSRSIAETHYQLGVAMGFNLQFDEAVGALNDAIYVLEKRVSNLKEKKESQGKKKLSTIFKIFFLNIPLSIW
jgi:nuclear autoantigenic sperm protein